MRDAWNILDFIIVLSSYISLIYESEESTLGSSVMSLRGLRTLRVLKPLRTFTRIKSLRVIITTILEAIPLLKYTILILIFYFVIFATAGLNLFMGLFKYQCVRIETGISDENMVCGYTSC